MEYNEYDMSRRVTHTSYTLPTPTRILLYPYPYTLILLYTILYYFILLNY